MLPPSRAMIVCGGIDHGKSIAVDSSGTASPPKPTQLTSTAGNPRLANHVAHHIEIRCVAYGRHCSSVRFNSSRHPPTSTTKSPRAYDPAHEQATRACAAPAQLGKDECVSWQSRRLKEHFLRGNVQQRRGGRCPPSRVWDS
jgi:hypothetical protein